MTTVLYALGAVALVLGVAGVVLPVLPGALLLAAGALLVAWAEDFTRVSGWTVALVGVLAVGLWALDLVAAALGAKVTGASRWAAAGASLGLVVGVLTLGPVGLLLGPAVGAVALEYWKDPDLRRAARAGAGAFVGFVVGSVVKVTLAFGIVGIVAAALVW